MTDLPALTLQELELKRGCSLALLIPFSSLLRTCPGPDRRAAARAVLRSILGKLASRSPESLRFAKTAHGKPYLEGIDSIGFNISHSKTYSLIALSRSGAVGCDIEDRFAEDDVGELCPLILHPVELDAMDRLPARARPDAFRRYWVRKEAVLKAVGAGFLDDPRRLIAGLEDLQARWSTQEGPRLAIHDQQIEAGCVAALAGTDPACSWRLLNS